MRLTIRLVGAALLFSAIAMSGCATAQAPADREPVIVTTGNGLSVVTVQESWVLQLLCQGAHSTPPGVEIIACVVPRSDEIGATTHFRRPPDSWGLTEKQVATFAEVIGHEDCHKVHQVIVRTYRRLEQYLPADKPAELLALIEKFKRDPCHDGNDGRLSR